MKYNALNSKKHTRARIHEKHTTEVEELQLIRSEHMKGEQRYCSTSEIIQLKTIGYSP